MSHDQTIRKVYGITLETAVRRIVRTFERASASDIEAGARWYDEAGDLAVDLAAHHGHTVEQTASVIAALSPRTTWARNVAGAALLVEHDEVLPGLIGRNVETARRALTDGYYVFGPTAPKTGRFARNIAGDRESVTVDVWAARVVGVDEDLLSRKGAYDAIEHAYRLAARRLGVDPATAQATTWIVARNGRAA
jgi:hypothetical protein